MSDQDFKFLKNLQKEGDTHDSVKPEDHLQLKLLYLILEEVAAQRRRTDRTNDLLADISESLKKNNAYLSRLARATVYTDRYQESTALRIYKD